MVKSLVKLVPQTDEELCYVDGLGVEKRKNYGEAILNIINEFVKKKAIKMLPFEIPDVQADYNANTQRKRSKGFESYSLTADIQNAYEDDDFSEYDRNFEYNPADRFRNSQHFVSQTKEATSSKYFGKDLTNSAKKEREQLERDIELGMDLDDF